MPNALDLAVLALCFASLPMIAFTGLETNAQLALLRDLTRPRLLLFYLVRIIPAMIICLILCMSARLAVLVLCIARLANN